MMLGRAAFELDPRLQDDSHALMDLGLCELRMMDERRWPWVMLVPQRAGITELHELTPLDQAMLTFEVNTVAEAVKAATGCLKINTGALGNIVRQLHVHVVARFEGDEGWPGPVWGRGKRKPYHAGERERFSAALHAALSH